MRRLLIDHAQRMLIENGIYEAVQFFHLDALSSMVGLKVDFDLQLTLMAGSLYRLLAERVHDYRVVVRLDNRTHNRFLASSGLTDQPTPMPWFGNKPLSIQFA